MVGVKHFNLTRLVESMKVLLFSLGGVQELKMKQKELAKQEKRDREREEKETKAKLKEEKRKEKQEKKVASRQAIKASSVQGNVSMEDYRSA